MDFLFKFYGAGINSSRNEVAKTPKTSRKWTTPFFPFIYFANNGDFENLYSVTYFDSFYFFRGEISKHAVLIFRP